MALLINTAESGAADGTLVGAGSAHPDAFTSVSNTAITYQTGAAQKGARGFRLTGSGTTTSYIGWTGVAGASNAAAVRLYLRFSALPTGGSAQVFKLLSSGGGTGLVNMVLDVAGKLRIGSDPAVAELGTTAEALSPNTWYRLELGITNPGTTTGTATLRVYAGDTTTVVASLDLSAANFGTSLIGTVRFGRYDAGTHTFTVDFDDVAFQTGSATLLGPSTAPVAAERILIGGTWVPGSIRLV